MANPARKDADVLESLETAAAGHGRGVGPCGVDRTSPTLMLLLSLSFGLWWAAWFLVRIRNAGWASPLELGSPFSHEAFLGVGTGAFVLSFVLIGKVRSVASLLGDRRFLLGVGAINGLIIAFEVAMGERPTGAVLAFILLVTWEFVSAVLLVAWVGRIARLRLRAACIVACGALMFGGLIYGIVGAFFAPDSIVAAIAAGVLQPVCALLLVGSGLRPEAGRRAMELPDAIRFRLPTPLLAGIGAYGAAIGFMVRFAGSGSRSSSTPQANAALAIVLMSLIVLVSVLAQRRVHIRAAYASVLVFLIIGYMLIPIGGIGYGLPVAMAAYTGLEAAWITTVVILVRCARVPSLHPTCWAAAVTYGSALLGGTICSAVQRVIPLTATTLSLIPLGVAIVLIPVTVYLLGEDSLTTVWGLLNGSDAAETMDPAELASIRCCALAARYSLTEREAEILRLLVLGSSPDEIGRALYISSHTVRTHVKRIHEKLGVHSQPQLISMVVFGERASMQPDSTTEVS